MLKNFLTVAVRNFLRQRFYSAINVFGLASGLTCVLFIFLWVTDELAVDKFHKDGDRIYRVISNLEIETGEIVTWNITPGPLADDIRENIPEVEMAVRTMDNGAALLQFEDKGFLEYGLYADSDFFKLFSYPIVSGNAEALTKSSIAVSASLAKRLFGERDPLGSVIKVAKKYDLEVGAVFQDVGARSSIKFEFILPFEVYREIRGAGFGWNNYDHPLYLKLHEGADIQATIGKIYARQDERMKKIANPNDRDAVTFYMQPFSDNYLHANFENGVPVGGRILYVQAFSIVATFILVIACINFMNMATARAASRAKEVGVRKVVGAQRTSLILQFIGESLVISLVAMIAAAGVVFMLLPLFNNLVSKDIAFDLTDPFLLLSMIAIVVIAGILAGSYPAFFLSAYRPATVLKGNMAAALSGSVLRKTLVVFQFTLTVILVASAMVILQQVEYIRSKNIGYNRKEVIRFSATGDLGRQFEAFKNDAKQIAGVQRVTRGNQSLVQVNNHNSSVTWQGKPDNSSIFFRTVVVDHDFLETLGLELVEGRLFSEAFNDTSSYIVSEKAVETMGMINPVGQKISQWDREGAIVGVVKDFHSRSLVDPVDPIIFMFRPQWSWQIFIRFDGSETAGVVEGLTALTKKYSPEYPFEYTFLDDDFEKLYKNEKVTGSLAVGFTIMAIIISGLGLLGLAAYSAERRRKEIGIRKTMGASVPGIVSMMSGDFMRLSLLAALIGCPIAWWLTGKFLSGFAYHADPDWALFAMTAVGVTALSLTIVIYQVTKAALANPVDALRNE